VGQLNGVEFRNIGPQCEEMPPNKLTNCDFTNAELIDCQFIKLGLDPNMFPLSDDWIILPNGPDDLRKWQEFLPKPDLFVKLQIDYVGAPTMLSRSLLKRARYTDQQIQQLIDIASSKVLKRPLEF
jgi:hypothetical protein